MSHVRSLGFEDLEDRKLLSHGHIVAHPKHAFAATPLVLDGTLTVNDKKATTMMDAQGNTTTSIPWQGNSELWAKYGASGMRAATPTETTWGPTL